MSSVKRKSFDHVVVSYASYCLFYCYIAFSHDGMKSCCMGNAWLRFRPCSCECCTDGQALGSTWLPSRAHRLLHTPNLASPTLRTVPHGHARWGDGARVCRPRRSVCFKNVADPSPALHSLGLISSARFHQSLWPAAPCVHDSVCCNATSRRLVVRSSHATWSAPTWTIRCERLQLR